MTAAPVTRTRRSLARIDALDAELRACILVRREAAAEAERVDGSLPLAGWTIAVKDNIDVAGTVRTDGLGPPHPPPASADAEAVRRLRDAGAVVVAKANLEQLSFGATTQNPTWGSCRNPWDRSRIPGGSSGGSAVAVAAELVDAALGTDTGGSLRNAAAFCGVCTLRPTHALVPMCGVTPLSPSMDVVGPMARSVAEVRELMRALAGITPLARPLAGLSVGVPRAYFLEALEPDVGRSFDALLALLEDQRARVVELELPGVEDVPDAMSALLNAEAATSLRAYWDDPRLSDGIRERLDLGRAVTTAQLASAARVAAGWRAAVGRALGEVDVIATPATPFAAPPVAADNLVALSRRINRTTGCWSLAGTPALVLPLPPSSDGLPVGAQLIAARGADARLLAAGEAIQAATDWHERRVGA